MISHALNDLIVALFHLIEVGINERRCFVEIVDAAFFFPGTA